MGVVEWSEVAGLLANGPVLCCVFGPAGVGKTHCLTRLGADAEASHYRVVKGFADEPGSNPPLRLATEVVRRMCGHDRFESDVTKQSTATVAELSRALIDVVEKTTTAPTVLLLDDVHDADGIDVDWLVELRRSVTARVTIIACGRDLPGRLVTAADLSVELKPFEREDAIRISTHALGATPGPKLTRMIETAAGLPAAIVELIDSATQDELLVTSSDGTIDLEVDELPRSMTARSARRLARLGPEAQALAFAAAVIGERVDPTLVSQVADLATAHDSTNNHGSGTSSLERLVRSGMLMLRENHLVWSHELIRESVLAGIPPELRADLEWKTCLRLIEQGHSTARVHAHLDRSNATVSDRRSVYLRAVDSDDSVERVRALRWLAQDETGDPARRVELLRSCCAAAEDAGLPEALHWAAAALVDLDRTDAHAWQSLLFSLMSENRMAEAVTVAAGAIDHVGDPSGRAKLTASMALAALTSLDPSVEAQLDHASVIAANSSDPEVRIAVGSVRSRIAAHRFCTQQATDEAMSALEAFQSAIDPDETFEQRVDDARLLRYQPHFFAALACFEADDLPSAKLVLADGSTLARRSGYDWAISTLASLTSLIAATEGDNELAEQAALEAIGAGRISHHLPTALAAFAVLARLRLQAGEEMVCAALLDEADRLVAAGGKFGIEHVTCVRMELLHRMGRGREALDLGSLMFDGFRTLSIGPAMIDLAPLIVNLAAQFGEPTLIDRIATVLRDAVPDNAPPIARIVREWAEACRQGDFTSADLLAGSIPANRAILVERMTALGTPETGPDRSHDPTAVAHLVGSVFTPTELLVAERLATGCSNREIAALCFMSVRTAESHVARINRKLGVRSRTQAIAHLARAGANS